MLSPGTGFSNGTNDFTNAYTYDALQNMTSVVETIQATPNNAVKTASFGYDADNRLTGLAESYNTSGTNNAVVSAAYTYDYDSNLTGLSYTSPSGGATLAAYHWDYDNDNRVTDMYSRNDTAGTPGPAYSSWGEAAYGYDHDSQLTATT